MAIIKFIVIGDPHIRKNPPSTRIDDFSNVILRKLMGISNLIKHHQAEMVIIPGDIFDSPRVDLALAGTVNNIIKSWDVDVYVVAGNHDLYGNNPKTLYNTMLGYAIQSGVLKLLTRKKNLDITTKDGTKVHIEGQQFHELIDDPQGDIEKDFGVRYPTTGTDINILVTHSYLFYEEKFPFLSRSKKQTGDKIRPYCTLVEDIPDSNDLIITGHYHEKIPVDSNIKPLILNPGSFTRTSITKRDIYYGLVSIENKKVSAKILKFPYAPKAIDIFDFTQHEEKKTRIRSLDDYKMSLSEAKTISSNDTYEVINNFASENNIPKEVLDKAIEKYTDSDTAFLNDESLVAQGYTAEKDDVMLEKVEIKNFMSHSKTTVDFTDGLNVLTGKSNSGKSAIFRAIIWCLFNKPTGSDFIRTGAQSTKVTVTLSNGYSITRQRSRKATGFYLVKNPNGETTKFEKIKSVPVEVSNASQMPIVKLSDNYSVCLNISTQLEGPFLLSSSSADKAAAIGRLRNMEPLDNTIYKLNSENLSNSKLITSKKKEKDELENKLSKEFSHLDKHKQIIDALKSLHQQTDDKLKESEKLESLLVAINKSKFLCTEADKLIKASNSIISCQNLKEETDKLISDLLNLVNLSAKMTTLEKQIKEAESKLDNSITLCEQENNIESLRDDIETINSLSKLSFSHSTLNNNIRQTLEPLNLDIEKAKEVLQETLLLSDKLKEINETKNKRDKLILNIKNSEKDYNKALSEIDKPEEELKQLIEANNICPLCGNKMSKDKLLKKGDGYEY